MSPDTHGRRIVIADNDRTVLELIQIRLDIAGYHTFVERTGPAAMEAIRTMRPAAVILDLNLPVMDGFEILRALKTRSDAPPALVMGRRLAMEDIQRAVALGARDCMTKPFSGADLIERVTRMFRRPGAQQPAVDLA